MHSVLIQRGNSLFINSKVHTFEERSSVFNLPSVLISVSRSKRWFARLAEIRVAEVEISVASPSFSSRWNAGEKEEKKERKIRTRTSA